MFYIFVRNTFVKLPPNRHIETLCSAVYDVMQEALGDMWSIKWVESVK